MMVLEVIYIYMCVCVCVCMCVCIYITAMYIVVKYIYIYIIYIDDGLKDGGISTLYFYLYSRPLTGEIRLFQSSVYYSSRVFHNYVYLSA